MQVTLDIPDTLAAQLAATGRDPARAALEVLLVEGYRTRVVTEGQIRRAFGYATPMQVHALLKEYDVPLNYTMEDLEQDRQTIRSLGELQASAAV